MNASRVRLALLCALSVVTGSITSAATLTVSTLSDELVDRTNHVNDCSLREAVISVNEGGNRYGCSATGTYGQNDTIVLPEGTMNLLRTQGSGYARAGRLDILRDVIIVGQGASKSTVSAAALPREFNGVGGVFNIGDLSAFCAAPNPTVVLRGMTITGGSVSFAGGGIYSCGNAALTLDAVLLTGNTATYGAGLSAHGTVTILGSTISGNTAENAGGGGELSGAELEMLNSTISGNEAGDRGGGLYFSDTDAELSSVTITGNEAASGQGGGLDAGSPGNDVRVRNTLIAANLSGGSHTDCSGTFDSFGFNLIGDATGCAGFDSPSDETGTTGSPLDPLLGPLANNGGTTPTHMPASDSPAVDEGGIPQITDPLRVDQRGVERPMDGNGDGTNRYDIGAVERAGTANADVNIGVVDTQDPSPLGNVFFYEMTVRNDGPAPTTDVVASGFVTGGEIVNWATCDMAGPTGISCFIGDLDVGEEVSRSFTVFPDNDSTEMTAAVEVVSDLPDPLLSNNSATEATAIGEPSAILDLDLSDSVDPVLTGQVYTYRAAVSNVGTGGTGTITLQGSIGSGATVAATSADCSVTSSTTFECDGSNLGHGEVKVLEVDVLAPDVPATVELEVVASATIADAVQARTSTQVVAPAANLRMRKAGPSGVLVGTQFAYSLTVSHEGGNAPAEAVVVKDTLPPDVNPLAVQSGPIPLDCAVDGLEVECTLEALAPGEETVLLITVEAPANEGEFTNEATVASSTSDPDPSDNTDSVTSLAVLDVEPAADLGVVKSAPQEVEPGETFTYQVSVFNNGPDTAEGVVMTDVLPAELELDFAPLDCDGTQTVTCEIGSIDPGDLASFEIEVVAPGDYALLTNVASVTSTTDDPHPDNDSASAITVVTPVQTGGSPIVAVQQGPSSPQGGGVAGAAVALQAELINLSLEAIEPIALTLRATGTGPSLDGVRGVRVYGDADADGVVDEGEELLASGDFDPDDGTSTLALEVDPTPAGGTMTALVVVDLEGQIAGNLAPVAAISLATLVLVSRRTHSRSRLTLLVAAGLLAAGCVQQQPPPSPPADPVSYQVVLEEVEAQGVDSGLPAVVVGVPLEGAVLEVE